ncbi:MAG: DUF6101 family protein [Xanthobacteraceae bacterium]|nr:DUF6101 family protein [Xanthobacteraceae bacterium]
MRRQTATGGLASAGSGRIARLDPHSLPVSFEAHDTRADGNIRHIELHREHIVLRRAVHGMRMAINVRMRDFLGVAIRDDGDTQTLVLLHRDPSLSVPLCEIDDPAAIDDTWRTWSDIFALPQLVEIRRQPSPRRRRRNAVAKRRPRFLARRRAGGPLTEATVHRDEREIIARE